MELHWKNCWWNGVPVLNQNNDDLKKKHKWLLVILSDDHQTSNISHILVGNKFVDHSDEVGASVVGAAPTKSSFSTEHLTFNGLGKDNCKTRWETFKLWDLVWLILEIWWYSISTFYAPLCYTDYDAQELCWIIYIYLHCLLANKILIAY